MTLRWTWLLVSVALLMPPPLLSAELRKIVISVRRNASLSVSSLVRPWQNWIDFLRSLLGMLILTRVAITPAITPDSVTPDSSKPLAFQFAVIFCALLLQITRSNTQAPRPEHRVQSLTRI